MDFFEHQAVARRNTGKLIFLFLLAITAIIAAIYFVAMFALRLGLEGEPLLQQPGLWHPQLLLVTAMAVIILVAVGTLSKILILARGGGQAVAESLGGVPVDPSTREPKLKRYANIVEEMAIASGVPMPAIYVLPNESAINAFAAGFKPTEAAVAVTQGCLDRLSRDELQGVVAHEFSHILHGDMRLNLRLIGILHGILLIGLTGRMLLYGFGRGRRRSSDNKGAGAILIIALALFIIGYIGVFFANLIKSAVSRQREFLADASAVQFTRQPAGIAGALKKIGGFSSHGELETANASQASHLFFANGLASAWMNMLATHPPLDERIRRIEPDFNGSYPETDTVQMDMPAADQVSGFSSTASVPPETRVDGITPETVTAQVGNLEVKHLTWAAALLKKIPDHINEAIHNPFGARAVVYGLLLDQSNETLTAQMQLLKANADPQVLLELDRLSPALDAMDRLYALPIIEIAMPALRQLSVAQYKAFRENVALLIKTDKMVSLFEYALHRMLLRHLDRHFKLTSASSGSAAVYSKPRYGYTVLLSTLAHMGGEDAQAVFNKSVGQLELTQRLSLLERDKCTIDAIDQALTVLENIHPLQKRHLIKAAVVSVSDDGKLAVAEAELLRAICDALDCPLPPILR